MKKIYTILFLLFFLNSIACVCYANRPSVSLDKVLEIIHRANVYWQANHSKHGRAFWDNAAYHVGNMEAYFQIGRAHV